MKMNAHILESASTADILKLMRYKIILFVFFMWSTICRAQFEETRCRCACPSPSVVRANHSERMLYIKSVAAQFCTCDVVVIPQLEVKIEQSKVEEFCVQCECKFQSRNTTLIKVSVIITICVISVLAIYMLFLQCLNPLLLRPRRLFAYAKHVEEDISEDMENIFAAPISAEAIQQQSTSYARQRVPNESVLKRMEVQQSRWMANVEQQRKKIFKEHSMLN
ncbi:Transmembrane protein 9 [Trichinella nelsoni]|uniref:Transmembrane protein 9 n=2 Tax=Trichinella TaxID=6333 RepID=A0A0V0S302_9BILA|nr:Transmembrane protein 9 [Trichinella nelsoni]